jgi:hypothetical protein
VQRKGGISCLCSRSVELLSCFVPWQQKGMPGIESSDGSARRGCITQSYGKKRSNDLVQGGPHIVDSISRDKANLVGSIMQLHPQDMPLIFYVILAGKGIGLRWRSTEGSKFWPKSIKMFLRPTQLRIRAIHTRDNESINDPAKASL